MKGRLEFDGVSEIQQHQRWLISIGETLQIQHVKYFLSCLSSENYKERATLIIIGNRIFSFILYINKVKYEVQEKK